VVVEPLGRGAAWRAAAVGRAELLRAPAVRRALLAVLAVAALALAGWGGVRALGVGSAEAGGPPVVPSSTAPATAAEAGDVPSPADAGEIPADLVGWRAVVADLYGRRGAAFADPSSADFGEVYPTAGPLRTADEQHARELAAAGEALRGFAPHVVAVNSVEMSADRAELDLVDRWPDYEVVAASGPDARVIGGRGDAPVRLVLLRTADGWRIEGAERRN
jgi:hypothetical protein